MAIDKKFVVQVLYESSQLQKLQKDLRQTMAVARLAGAKVSDSASLISTGIEKMIPKAGGKRTSKFFNVLQSDGEKIKVTWKQVGGEAVNMSAKITKATTSLKNMTSPIRSAKTELESLSKINKKFANDLGKKFSKAVFIVKKLPEALSSKKVNFKGKVVTEQVSKMTTVVATANGRIQELTRTLTRLPNGMTKVKRNALDITDSFQGWKKEISKTVAEMKKIDKATAKSVASLRRQRIAQEKTAAAQKKAADSQKTYGDSLRDLSKRALTVIPIWLALRSAFTGILQVIKGSISFLIAWEFQMAQIAIVSSESKESLRSLSTSLLTLASNLGISNAQLGEGSKLFAQQGRAISEIIPLMNATAKLSLLTGRNITTSVEDMTAVLKAYKLEAGDANSIVDTISNTMLNHAITAGDLAQAYKATASTAASLGVSLSGLTGFVTAIKTVTRDTGSKVGLTLRTIFSRITTSSSQALQILTKVPLFLDEMGEATTRSTPKLRNLEIVMRELAQAFNKADTAQKSQIASLVGGVRRQNQVFALFENFTEAIEAQADALFGLGKADKAIETLTDTTKLSIEQMKGAWDLFVDTVQDTSAITTAAEVLKTAFNSLTFIADPKAFQQAKEVLAITEKQSKAQEKVSFVNATNTINTQLQLLRDSKKISQENKNFEAKIIKSKANLIGIPLGVTLEGDTPSELLESVQDQKEFLIKLKFEGDVDIIKSQVERDFIGISNNLTAALGDAVKNFKEGEATGGILANAIKLVLLQPLNENSIQKLVDSLQNATAEDKVKLLDVAKQISEDKNDGTFDIVKAILKNAGTKQGILRNLTKDLNDFNKRQGEILVKDISKQKSATPINLETLTGELGRFKLDSAGTDITKLEIAKEELRILKQTDELIGGTLDRKKANLIVTVKALTAEKTRNDLLKNKDQILRKLKRSGASDLTVLLTELALLEKIGGKEEELNSKRADIADKRVELERSSTNILLDGQLALLEIQGKSSLQITLSRIELEKKLGVEKKGLELLQQQLGLQQDIAKEEKVSRSDRLKNLGSAIAERRKEQRQASPDFQKRLDRRQSRLTDRAKDLGFSKKDIQKLLDPTKGIEVKIPSEFKILEVSTTVLNTSMGTLEVAVKDLAREISGGIKVEDTPSEVKKQQDQVSEVLTRSQKLRQSQEKLAEDTKVGPSLTLKPTDNKDLELLKPTDKTDIEALFDNLTFTPTDSLVEPAQALTEAVNQLSFNNQDANNLRFQQSTIDPTLIEELSRKIQDPIREPSFQLTPSEQKAVSVDIALRTGDVAITVPESATIDEALVQFKDAMDASNEQNKASGEIVILEALNQKGSVVVRKIEDIVKNTPIAGGGN